MRSIRPWLIFSVIFLAVATAGRFAEQSYSANLTNVSVTLSNSRLSFKGALGAGNTEGSSQVTINSTPGAYPSTSSAQLQQGDVVKIGELYSMASHTITGISATNAFEIGTTLAAGDIEAGDDVISSQSAEINVDFTTANAVADGKFQILLPAETNNNIAKDGIPDRGFFDFTDETTTINLVTCPANTGNYAFNEAAADATASAATIGGLYYHVYECGYSGAGGIGTTINDFKIVNVINPAPKTGHIDGTADTYKPIIRQLNSSDVVVDQTTVSIGVIEAVKVTATVAPLITFKVLGVTSGTSACGNNTSVTTTATSVPFGELLIDSFTHAAQALTVSTNASDGYAVTTTANDQLSRNNAACAGATPTSSDCIVDAIGDSGTMDYNVFNEWTTTTVKGFGYSLHDVNTSGLTPAFQYTTNSGACDGNGNCFRQFPDAEAIAPPVEAPTSIFSANDVADNHNLYVCYRAVVSNTQAAGEYENYITYTATANF